MINKHLIRALSELKEHPYDLCWITFHSDTSGSFWRRPAGGGGAVRTHSFNNLDELKQIVDRILRRAPSLQEI